MEEMLSMEVINKDIKQCIALLSDKIVKYLGGDKNVDVHIHINDMIIRNSITLDEFEISESKIHILAGWFHLDIQNTITNIEYVDFENSVYIEFDNGIEMNIDL